MPRAAAPRAVASVTPVAITTARAATSVPSDVRTTRTSSRADRCGGGLAEDRSAPNSQACSTARTGELLAADPPLEAEVVADHRAGPGLAAGDLRLDDHRLEPLRRGVDGGGEAGRPGTDHHDVAVGRGRPRLHAERRDQLGIGRVVEHDAGVEGEDGQHGPVPVGLRAGGGCPRRCRRRGTENGIAARLSLSRMSCERAECCVPTICSATAWVSRARSQVARISLIAG